MAKDERQFRRLFCEVGRWLYDRGWAVATDGNLSVRLAAGSYMFTPAGCCLGRLQPDEMVVTDAQGAPQRAGQQPSSEWRLHLACYGARPDVLAVIHAHPPWVLSACAAGLSLDRHVLPEVVFHLGTIRTAAYATPSSPEAAEAVRELVGVHDAIVLDRHGAVTVNATLEGAFMKLERVELAARIILTATSMSVLRVLPRDEVQKLKELRAEHGLNPEAVLDDPNWTSQDE